MKISKLITLITVTLLSACHLHAVFCLGDGETLVNSVARQSHPYVYKVSTPEGYGTGFFVSTNLMVTNIHVVKGCEQEVYVNISDNENQDKIIRAVDVIKSPKSDIALLRFDSGVYEGETLDLRLFDSANTGPVKLVGYGQGFDLVSDDPLSNPTILLLFYFMSLSLDNTTLRAQEILNFKIKRSGLATAGSYLQAGNSLAGLLNFSFTPVFSLQSRSYIGGGDSGSPVIQDGNCIGIIASSPVQELNIFQHFEKEVILPSFTGRLLLRLQHAVDYQRSFTGIGWLHDYLGMPIKFSLTMVIGLLRTSIYKKSFLDYVRNYSSSSEETTQDHLNNSYFIALDQKTIDFIRRNS